MTILNLPKIPYTHNVSDLIEATYGEVNNISAAINLTLRRYLHKTKCEIDGKQDSWDRCKKYTNPYEYIHTPVSNSKLSVCRLKPLSRSFYKMIEICRLINLLEGLPPSFKSFHFAEGPGGFIEAICSLTEKQKNTHYGMTLIDTQDPAVPGWKKSAHFLETHPNVIIEYGADQRGDLFTPENLTRCIQKYKGKINLVTADGGFDFSTDFNKQESSGLKLLIAQIMYAIAVQKKGGFYIVKFFDTFTQTSIDLLYILSMIYEQVQIIKPCTSRHANSEKYIVCSNFRLDNSEPLVRKLATILYDVKNKSLVPSKLLQTPPPYYFVNRLEECNAILGQQQIESISNTLCLIENARHDKIENMKKTNIQKCINWCIKHNLPHYKSLPSANIFLGMSNHELKNTFR